MSDTDRVERVARAIKAEREKRSIGYVAPSLEYDVGIDATIARAALAAADQWLPIESAPTAGTVLLWSDGEMVMGFPLKSGAFWEESISGRAIRPTHWRPLPAPPEING
jgi:hypothetical protein